MVTVSEKYKILKELGQGGSGTVYLVQHTDLDVNYALKILNRHYSEDDRFIEQFKKEASLLLKFTHPGVTQLRDFGRTNDGLYYMAMDYCDGRLLKSLLDQHCSFTVEQSLQIAIQLLEVLEAAHQQGIVHRDIKPENIMLVGGDGEEPKVKILDFGTAVLKQHAGEEEASNIFGTPCYMSPEQAAGEDRLDHRIDIYAVGIVLFELLTGSVPFEGDTIVQTLLMHLTKPVPSLANKYGLNPEIDHLLSMALAKDRSERFQGARPFRIECQKLLNQIKQNALNRSSSASKKTRENGVNIGLKSEPKGLGDLIDTRILCLDDDPMILNIMQHILEKEGYQVYATLDSSTIHNYLFSEHISLLISDVEMPGLPGTKVCRLLKQSMKDLKIVLFSNLPEKELAKHAKENLADGWISKQKKPNEWLEEIKKILDSSSLT